MKFAPVILLSCAIKMESFFHNKSVILHSSSKVNQEISKLLRYFSGIMTFKFKNDTDGCASWSLCREFGVLVIFLMILLFFLFYTKIIFHLKHYQ